MNEELGKNNILKGLVFLNRETSQPDTDLIQIPIFTFFYHVKAPLNEHRNFTHCKIEIGLSCRDSYTVEL